ncbi:unnamed protein product, partial [Acidocella sp. C78]
VTGLSPLASYSTCRIVTSLRISRRQKRKTHPYHNDPGDKSMWTKPKLVEIAVGTEINCYACADLG